MTNHPNRNKNRLTETEKGFLRQAIQNSADEHAEEDEREFAKREAAFESIKRKLGL